jgi:predicted nucleic acid-binding protein
MNDGRGLVVDASVAVKWLLRDEDLVEEADALLRGFAGRRLTLAAPTFIRYEVANVVEQARRRLRIDADRAGRMLRLFLSLAIHRTEDDDDLVIAARSLAERFGLSAYDAVYVAQAERLGYALVTNDARLLQDAARYPVPVYALADVASIL